MSFFGHDDGDGEAAEDREGGHHHAGHADGRRVDLALVADLAGVVAADLHAGEGHHDAGDVDEAGQALPLRDDVAAREGDLRRLAGAEPPQAEHDDDHRGHGGADDDEAADPVGHPVGAGHGGDGRAPEDAEHGDHEERPVRRQVGVDHVGHGGGEEEQHGGEPGQVLRPVAPHGEEAPARAEGLAHPGVDAALLGPGGGQLGRRERHRDQVGHHGHDVEEDARPAEGGAARQVADAVHGRQQHEGEADHAEGAAGAPGQALPGAGGLVALAGEVAAGAAEVRGDAHAVCSPATTRPSSVPVSPGSVGWAFGGLSRWPTTGSSTKDSARATAMPARARSTSASVTT